MILLAVYEIVCGWVEVLILYGCLFWRRVSDLVLFRNGSDSECPSFCANLGKSATETLAITRQAFREEGKSSTLVFKVKSKAKSMLIPLTSRVLFTKNSSWQAKQSIPHTTLTFYGDCGKMCEHFAPNFDVKEMAVESQQRSVPHFLFYQKIFDLKQHDCRPPPTLLDSIFPTDDKTKWRIF
jgi:hypothetical protein